MLKEKYFFIENLVVWKINATFALAFEKIWVSLIRPAPFESSRTGT